MTYDGLGRRTSETDQAGKTTQFAYDKVGRLVKVTDALLQETDYVYDEVGNRTQQIDANDHVTRFEHDALGRTTKRILPDGKFEAMSYYPDGTLASHTDFNGATRTFEYDTNGRLKRRAYPDSTAVTFTYTPTGQRETVTESRGTTTYTYDSRDRLLEKLDPAGYSLSYTWDANGNRTALTATVDTETYTTAYTYDELDRLATVIDSQNDLTTLGYDANGNRTRLAHPNGVTTDYVYDEQNRLEDLTTANSAGDILASYAYTLGPAGNRTRIDEHDGTSRHYTYDDLYRLTQDRVTDASTAQVYQRDFVYDPVGNRLRQTIEEGSGPTTIASTYDNRDRLLSADATSYSWDENGNLAAKTDTTETIFEWGLENRLTSVVLEDSAVIATVYDADGNRVRTVVTPHGASAVTVDYLVDTTGFLSHVVAEVVDGSTKTLYTRADDQLIALYRPASMGKRFYHADGIGSVHALSDEAGTITDRYSYTSFGTLLQHSGADPQRYLFAGEQLEARLGFHYNRARWMDPASGRFISRDAFAGTLDTPQTLHKYVYASLDPVNRWDPTGLFTLTAEIGAIQVFGVLALGAMPTGGKKRQARPMTIGERQMADTVYRGAINYDRVKIIKGRIRSTFLPLRNRMIVRQSRIYYHPRSTDPARLYYKDFSVGPIAAKREFIHELTHVWQYQTGRNLAIAAILARVARGRTYTYKPVDPHKTWEDHNMEQQGEIVGDYFMLLKNQKDPTRPSRTWFESMIPWLQSTPGTP